VTAPIYFHLKRIEENKGLEYLVTVENYVRFQFEREYSVQENAMLNFTISDKSDSIVYNSETAGQHPVAYGMNRYVLDPCLLNLSKDEPYYKLILYNNKRQGYYLYFRLSEDLYCD
jgi:hypothetical protein